MVFADRHLACSAVHLAGGRVHDPLHARLGYVAEDQQSVGVRTEYSVFSRSRSFRLNPPVRDGNLRALRAEVRIGEPPVPFDLVISDALEMQAEFSDPRVTSGDVGYARYHVSGTLSVPTFGEAFFLRPLLRLRAFAGTSSGVLPPQRWFDSVALTAIEPSRLPLWAISKARSPKKGGQRERGTGKVRRLI